MGRLLQVTPVRGAATDQVLGDDQQKLTKPREQKKQDQTVTALFFYLDTTNTDNESQEGHFQGTELTLTESWIFKSLWKSLRTAQKLTHNQTETMLQGKFSLVKKYNTGQLGEDSQENKASECGLLMHCQIPALCHVALIIIQEQGTLQQPFQIQTHNFGYVKPQKPHGQVLHKNTSCHPGDSGVRDPYVTVWLCKPCPIVRYQCLAVQLL